MLCVRLVQLWSEEPHQHIFFVFLCQKIAYVSTFPNNSFTVGISSGISHHHRNTSAKATSTNLANRESQNGFGGDWRWYVTMWYQKVHPGTHHFWRSSSCNPRMTILRQSRHIHLTSFYWPRVVVIWNAGLQNSAPRKIDPTRIYFSPTREAENRRPGSPWVAPNGTATSIREEVF